MSGHTEHRTTAAVAAVTFNSDRGAVDHLVAVARGRRAAPRTVGTVLRDLVRALAERGPGRHARTAQKEPR